MPTTLVKMGNLPTKIHFYRSNLKEGKEKNPMYQPGKFGVSNAHILKSKTQTVLLAKQAAILSPPLFQQTSKIPPLPAYVLTILPSFNDHICMDLSRDPLAKYSPLGLNATEYTGWL